jgi:MFS family permease
MEVEKPTTKQVEHIDNASNSQDNVQHLTPHRSEDDRFEHIIGLGYYWSKYFLGSLLATGMGLWCAVSTFAFVAPFLGLINNELGPDPRYIWISLVYNAVLAVFLAPVGRLSDIFGRRYFFIGGGVFGVVGSIVCATAKSIPALIGECSFFLQSL